MHRRQPVPPTAEPSPPTQPSSLPRELSKEQLKQWEAVLLMVGHFLKTHNRRSAETAFAKLKKVYQLKKKYSAFLASKLHLLQRRKSRDYQKWALAGLQANRIHFYASTRDEHARLK
jgi:hypothetical protein